MLGGQGLDFNTSSPIITSNEVPEDFDSRTETLACVSDAFGQLLFFSDGTTVWDKDKNIMPNGFDLTGLGIGTPFNINATQSTTQGTLIVPAPMEPELYYIFSLSSIEHAQNGGKLFYSVVDMRLNGGNGDVVPGQKGMLIDSLLSEKLTAVRGERCNIWVLTRSLSATNPGFRAYEINESGVNPGSVSSAIGNPNYFIYQLGDLTPSPHGRKLIAANCYAGGGNLELYAFDPLMGVFSNLSLLNDSLLFYAACFSPDGSKVYAITHHYDSSLVFQFDLNVSNPPASMTFLGTSTGFGKIKLGPDDKIYFRQAGNALAIIHAPNLPAPACNVEVNAIQFDSATCGGLPNVIASIPYDTPAPTRTDISGPCFANVNAAPLQSNDTTGWDYTWNTGVTAPELLADTPGTYWVTYHTPPCNYHVDTFHVRFPNGILPSIHVNPECRSDSNGWAYATTYPGDPVNYAYIWMQGTDTLSLTDTLAPVPSGSYSLHVQTNTGCDTLLYFDIPEENLQVSFEVSDTLICLGDTIQLRNTSDAHFTTYHWAFDNGDVSALPNPPSYVYPESGIYRIMLAGSGEVCQDTTYRTLLVDQPLLPVFEMELEKVCVGQAVSFFPKADRRTVQLVWAMEEQLRIENTVQHRYQHAFEQAGTYPITLHAKFRACPDTSYTDSITVYPLPEVDLGGDSSICLHGAPVYLKNVREAPLNPHRYLWSTGDTTATLKVVHPGTYTLSITTKPIGCTTTESILITKDCYIDIPNAFTPNGDGHNDYFFPRQLLTESVTRFHMQVFNRWGQVVFETTNLDGRGWDGRLNGKAQPMGVYLYRIEVGFIQGREEQYEGNVTLVR